MQLNSVLSLLTNETPASTTLQECAAAFDARFSRCHGLLHFLACRILGSHEFAEDAVQNCRLTALRNPRGFGYEGAFRSWLARILIDEALLILHREETAEGQTATQSVVPPLTG
jgi:DNA-directed RNA polymerase specialized sigma24 family protein